MSHPSYQPPILARALYAGSLTARLASTPTDPQAGGVSLVIRPDGSLLIASANDQGCSRAYADPEPGAHTDTRHPRTLGVLSMTGLSTLLATLTQAAPTAGPVQLHTSGQALHLRQDGQILATVTDQADTPGMGRASLQIPAAGYTGQGEHLPRASHRLRQDLARCPGLDPQDELTLAGVRGRPDTLQWWLGDWALGRAHALADEMPG